MSLTVDSCLVCEQRGQLQGVLQVDCPSFNFAVGWNNGQKQQVVNRMLSYQNVLVESITVEGYIGYIGHLNDLISAHLMIIRTPFEFIVVLVRIHKKKHHSRRFQRHGKKWKMTLPSPVRSMCHTKQDLQRGSGTLFSRQWQRQNRVYRIGVYKGI